MILIGVLARGDDPIWPENSSRGESSSLGPERLLSFGGAERNWRCCVADIGSSFFRGRLG
jgi:hypothetical protein